MEWLADILIFMIGLFAGYLIRRTVEEEFKIPCSDDDDR